MPYRNTSGWYDIFREWEVVVAAVRAVNPNGSEKRVLSICSCFFPFFFFS